MSQDTAGSTSREVFHDFVVELDRLMIEHDGIDWQADARDRAELDETVARLRARRAA